MSHHHSDSGQCSPTTGVNFLSDIWTQCRPLGPTVLERNSESLEGHLNDGMHCSRILIRRCRPYTLHSHVVNWLQPTSMAHHGFSNYYAARRWSKALYVAAVFPGLNSTR